jgi:hypothetical protein
MKHNSYLSKIKDVIDWAQGGPLSTQTGDYIYALERLDEYLEAFFETSPFAAGDRVVFKEDNPYLAKNGWSGRDLLFRKGSPATVGEVDFKKGVGWTAMFMFDHEYYNSEHEGADEKKNSRYTKNSVPRPIGDRHWFSLRQSHFVSMGDFGGEVLSSPWDGCACKQSDWTKNGQFESCGIETCKVWSWHHHGECKVHPDSIVR